MTEDLGLTVNLTLLVVMGVMLAAGVYLILERALTRVLLGIILISNGVNLLLLQTAGRSGEPPIVREGIAADEYFDPLPQALLLTAIVIAFALVSFLLALIYRSWVLARQDEVEDDDEDQRVARGVGAYDREDDAELNTETSEFTDTYDSSAGVIRAVGTVVSSPSAKNSQEKTTRDEERGNPR